VIGVGQDITELNKIRAEHEKASSAKSVFLATMSHEMRSPLNVILGGIQLLGETNLDERQKNYASMAEQSGKNLLSVIDDVLDISRIEADHIDLAPVDFHTATLGRELEQPFRKATADKNLVFDITISDDVPPNVTAPLARIRQVATNLIGNAIKFTEHGRVSVAISCAPTSADSLISNLTFEVLDTGPGVAPDEINSLFELFSQGDSSFTRTNDGVGLGLAISQRLVHAMGGAIGAEPRREGGSRFWFQVPVAVKHSGTVPGLLPNSTPDSDTNITTNTETGKAILVADDSHSNRLILSEYLASAGHEVSLAKDGQEALDAIQDGNFDLVLMDISMPVLDGLEVSRRLKARNSVISAPPIVALTAHALSDLRATCLEVGMVDYLTKPISKSELLDCVEKTLS